MPGRAAAIEAESREWIVGCESCGHEASYWELGGVRYGASSTGKRIRIACPSCGARALRPVERKRA